MKTLNSKRRKKTTPVSPHASFGHIVSVCTSPITITKTNLIVIVLSSSFLLSSLVHFAFWNEIFCSSKSAVNTVKLKDTLKAEIDHRTNPERLVTTSPPSLRKNFLTDLGKAKAYITDGKNVSYMSPPSNHRNDTAPILLFTVCQDGHGSNPKHGNPGLLCRQWWRSIGVWYNNTKYGASANVQVAMVSSKEPTNFINPERAPHWLKVLFTHAFLEHEFGYETVIFIDADSVIRFPQYNLNTFIKANMPPTVSLLLSEDDYDFVSTGEMFARAGIQELLKLWYEEAPKYFGRLSTPHETYLGNLKVSNYPQDSERQFNAYAKIKQFWKSAKEWADHNYDGALNPDKHNAPTQRCWGDAPSHEQGCFHHIINSAKHFLGRLKVIPAKEMHALRPDRMSPNPKMRGSGSCPFLHYCCTNYEERATALKACEQTLKAGRHC